MRLAPLLAVVALACDGPPLEFGPCQPERVGHVQAFGYYASSSHLAETLPYSSVVWGGVPALAAASAAGIRAVVDVQAVFRITDPARPDATQVESHWLSVAAVLAPDLPALAALYTSDEPYWNAARTGVPFGEVGDRLEEAARMIHATPGFEQVTVATIFARPELDWIASGEARNPAGYAWVGFDQYAASVTTLDRSARLFLRLLRPGQRVIAVPDAALLELSSDLSGLEERIAFWLAWVERHPEVVAIAPFIFWSGGGDQVTWTGAKDLPTIRDRYAQIGRCVIDANAGTSSAITARSPHETDRAPPPLP